MIFNDQLPIWAFVFSPHAVPACSGLSTQEQKNFINNIIDVSIKDLTGKLDFDWITKRKPIHSEELMVDKATFTSLTKYVAKNFYSNNNQYKEIRDNVIAHYNPNQITADNKRSFNEQLASSPLGLSFIDTIKAVLDQTGLHNVDNPTIYYISYMLLDMFGVSKNPRKKVKIHNLQVDSCHSFFGAYCDCIVSDDDGLRRKSQALYNLFHFSTQVYSIDEFIEKFDEAIYNNQKKLQEYFNEVISDYNHRQVVKSEKISEYTLTYIKSAHKYFGYFNCMLERQSKDETAIILRNYILFTPNIRFYIDSHKSGLFLNSSYLRNISSGEYSNFEGSI